MKFKKYMVIALTVLLFSGSMITGSARIDDDAIAEVIDDYYNVYGLPHLKAVVSSDNVFDRGDEGTLYVTIMNDGEITGFEADDDEIDDDIDSYGNTTTLSMVAQELLSDRKITTADSITAVLSLVDADAPIEMKVDTLLLGSLNSGKSLASQAAFPIKIYDNAKAGTYELELNMTYRWQKDSAVTPPYGDTFYWYEEANDAAILTIVIEEEPYFKITGTYANLTAGEEGFVNVTYTNTGDVTAYECIARISVVEPFSTTDDQAYLGNLGPGESKTALYKVDIEDDATPKTYSINSEVKYEDENDDIQYSKLLKAVVDVKAAVPFGDKVKDNATPVAGVLLLVGIIATPTYLFIKRKPINKNK